LFGHCGTSWYFSDSAILVFGEFVNSLNHQLNPDISDYVRLPSYCHPSLSLRMTRHCRFKQKTRTRFRGGS
jgi:hypothetical protein